ncbi:unnamed protein product [Closterium sp. NIES-64]|nr:unnamed protein product [Closterium sp. NIES-64]
MSLTDATSLKGSCGNIACLFAFDKILAQLDAVAASGSGPQFSRPTAKTLNALRHEAYHTAEELAFNLSVDLTRPMHGGEAEGAETGNVHKEATGAQVADHGVLALTGAAGVSNRGGARGGTEVHADDEGAEGIPRLRVQPAMRLTAVLRREGEESSEEEAEAHVVAAAASSRPATSGKSIKHLAQHLAPGAGSAGPSGEVAGKSPVTARLQAAELAEENARLKKRQESGVGGVAVVGSEELASALANAVREAVVLGRLDARLGQQQGVVTDSMEAAQKKLTDEFARKIDNMSTAVSATAERAITTSGVTNTLHHPHRARGGCPPSALRIMKERPRRRLPSPGMQSMERGQRVRRRRINGGRRGREVPRQWPRCAIERAGHAEAEVGRCIARCSTDWSTGFELALHPTWRSCTQTTGPCRGNRAVTSTMGRGKGKAEDGEAPAAARSLASRRGERGRWWQKKLPLHPCTRSTEDDADEELEGLVSRWVEAGDGGEKDGEACRSIFIAAKRARAGKKEDPVIVESGTTGGHGDTGPKRKGCGIRAPPQGQARIGF